MQALSVLLILVMDECVDEDMYQACLMRLVGRTVLSCRRKGCTKTNLGHLEICCRDERICTKGITQLVALLSKRMESQVLDTNRDRSSVILAPVE